MITQLTSGTQSGMFCSTGSNVWFFPACCNNWWPYGHLGFPDSSVGKESPPFRSWVRKIHWGRERLPTPVFLGFPCDSADKESAHNEGDLGSIPQLGRSPGEGKGYPLQYSGLEKSMNCIIYGVAKKWMRLSLWLSAILMSFYIWRSNHYNYISAVNLFLCF